MRSTIRYQLEDVTYFKKQLLSWARQFDEFIWLDSNEHADPYGEIDSLLAFGSESQLKWTAAGAFSKLQEYRKQVRDWIFGYFSYDLKNDIESLQSDGHDGLGFPALYFFQPRKIIRIKGKVAEFSYLDRYLKEADADYQQIISFIEQNAKIDQPGLRIRLRIFKDEYFRQVEQLLSHIKRGDVYELNFCQEYYAKDALIDPLTVYNHLNVISEPPFAAFMRIGEQYVISASPERFLQKKGNRIISQPIKGTARRSSDPAIDSDLKAALLVDPKERAENIMITDLVRNDLSKQAENGSVRVKELCAIYTYRQVHQLVSTIEARVPGDIDPVEIVRNAFPMGSMTGAPKISAMKLIERYENSLRGVYSGALGYFRPDGDFDFSVVIRTILYNRSNKYLSFSVGSAITSLADPENEYQECLIKAKAMRRVLGH